MSEALNQLKAKDIMRTSVVTVSESDPLNHLRDVLKKHSITGAPVVNDKNEVTGVVSMSDLIRFASGDNEIIEVKRKGESADFYTFGDSLECDYTGSFTEIVRNATVKDIMTPHIHGVQEEMTVLDVAKMMVDKSIHRVIVLNQNGMAGIISTLDVMKEMIQ